MTIWLNSKMTVLFYSTDEAWMDLDCYVRIDDEKILIEYEEDKLTVQYEGKNFGDGHFDLTSTHLSGHATLHRHPARDATHLGDSNVLVGAWKEDGYSGTWLIKLSSDDGDEPSA